MKKQLKGTVLSNKMTKTLVVRVDRVKSHAKYKKAFRISKKYKAHIEGGDYRIGDPVLIEECRPISKDKKWRVVKKLAQVEQDNPNKVSTQAATDVA